MKRLTLGLWLAVCGAAVIIFQLTPFGLKFYKTGDRLRDGWYGIPHASDLLLLAAMVAIVLFLATLLDRNPINGKKLGLVIGLVGTVAFLQLGYRVIAPPFSGKLGDFNGMFGSSCIYYCAPSMANKGVLLTGIWLALGGIAAVVVGGFLHAFSRIAGETPAASVVVEHQTGANLWLNLAAISAVGSLIAGYTIFVFYTLHHVKLGVVTFSGWIATPHTGGLVAAVALITIGLAWTASKRASFLNPVGIGATIAVLGAISASRIYFRITQAPFPAVRGPRDVEIGAYVSLALAGVVIIAGIWYALSNRNSAAQSAPENA